MSKYLGDFLRGDNVDCWWDSANSLGAAANPSSAGTVFVCVSLNSSTNTQVGVTLTSGIFTGIHSVRISTASAASFFLPERNFSVVAQGYTVDGQSVNKVLGQFSIENRYETGLIRRGTLTAGSASSASLDVDASSVNSFYDGGMILISDTTGKLQARTISSYAATGKIVTYDRTMATAPENGSTFRLYAGSLPTSEAELGTAIWTSHATRTLTGTSTATITLVSTTNSVTTVNNLAASSIRTNSFTGGAIDVNALAASALTSIGTYVWDELVTGHTGANSAGKVVTGISSDATTGVVLGLAQVMEYNKTVAGASSSAITLVAGSSATDDWYKGTRVVITAGTGVGQARYITAYNGTTKVATVDRTWGAVPVNTDTYAILPEDSYPYEPLSRVSTALESDGAGNYRWTSAAMDRVWIANWSSFAGQRFTYGVALAPCESGLATYIDASTVTIGDMMYTSSSTNTGLYDGATLVLGLAQPGAGLNGSTGLSRRITLHSGASRELKLTPPIPSTMSWSGTAVFTIQPGGYNYLAPSAITAGTIAASSLDSTKATADFYNEAADKLLARNIAGASSTGRVVKEALYPLRNKVDASSSVVTVYGTDDSTSAWTASVTTGGHPINKVDPAG